MEVQDVITFKPERAKVIKDPKIIDTLKDPNHWPILKALRKGPMTVRELEKEYAKLAAKDKEIEPKSEKTIYRYLKELKKAGLVASAGQRVEIGKTATETLFTRSADMFMIHGKTTDYRRDESGQSLAKAVASGLSHLYGKREIDIRCLEDFLSVLEKKGNDELIRFVEIADAKALDDLAQISWKKKDYAIERITILSIILNTPELFKKLEKCFK